ncbi:hypothetical protein BC835DRAFT_1425385 [Cytidiella melzeri]|nr:hypothetical protein BC835DRAFT_1425385 [Cytidiella melzeri]
MAVTAHWVDLGTDSLLGLRAIWLVFCQIYGEHTGKNLAQNLLQILKRVATAYKLGHTNNASNNRSMLKALSRLLRARNIEWDLINSHIVCFLHIVNIASNELIDGLEEVDCSDIQAADYINKDGLLYTRALTMDPVGKGSQEGLYMDNKGNVIKLKELLPNPYSVQVSSQTCLANRTSMLISWRRYRCISIWLSVD